MSLLLRSLLGGIGASPGGSASATQPQDTLWLRPLFTGAASYVGRTVTVEASLNLDTVVACVRLLSETVSAMPLKVWQQQGDTAVEAESSWQYELLHDRPNPEMPPVVLWGVVMTHLNSWGNAFLGKQMRGNRVVALWPIQPDTVKVAREGGVKVFYVRTSPGSEKRYTQAEIIHLQGFSLDGLTGLSPISLAREAVGAGLAIDEYSNRFFENGALPVGTLETDHVLDPTAIRRLERDWHRKYGGRRNAGRVAVLEQGMTFKSISLPLKDLEFISQQELTAKKICRFFRVPASMVDANHGDKSLTYRTVEGDNLQFLVHSVRVWLRRITQPLAMDPDLFPSTGRGSKLFPEHVVEDLLLTETLTRYQAHQIATGNAPWMLPSDVARIENMKPHPELDEKAIAQPAPEPTPETQREPRDR